VWVLIVFLKCEFSLLHLPTWVCDTGKALSIKPTNQTILQPHDGVGGIGKAHGISRVSDLAAEAAEAA
jgi:hypothetical protein